MKYNPVRPVFPTLWHEGHTRYVRSIPSCVNSHSQPGHLKPPSGRESTPHPRTSYLPAAPENPLSITSKHKNLGQSLSSSETELIEESALTLVRQQNHNHISHPMPRHCGSGKEHRTEGKKPGVAGLGLECDLLPNNYMLSAGRDHTLEFVPQGESAPCISRSPLPVFSITICNRACVGSEGKFAVVCECE